MNEPKAADQFKILGQPNVPTTFALTFNTRQYMDVKTS